MAISEEMKAILTTLQHGVDDFNNKLNAIEELLGAPYASDFPAATMDVIVDDVLKYNRCLDDIYKYVSRQIDSELRNMLIKHLEDRFTERLKKGMTGGD